MTTTKAIGSRTYTITPADDAAFLLLAEPNAQTASFTQFRGDWTIEFAPTLDSDATMVVMARAPGRAPTQNPPAFIPIMYKADYLNGAPVADPTVNQSAPISSASNITIAANGRSIALLISCSTGSCTIYTNGSQQS